MVGGGFRIFGAEVRIADGGKVGCSVGVDKLWIQMRTPNNTSSDAIRALLFNDSCSSDSHSHKFI